MAAGRQYASGGLTTVQYGGPATSTGSPITVTEMYSYTQPGQVAGKRMRVAKSSGTPADLNATWTCNNEGGTNALRGGSCIVMRTLTRRSMLCGLTASAVAAPHDDVLAAVREMEDHNGLKLLIPATMRRGPFDGTVGHPKGLLVGVRAVSPDANTIVYFPPLPVKQSPTVPFLVVENATGGVRPIWVEGQSPYLCGASDAAKVVVIRTSSLVRPGRKSLLALDLRSDVKIQDLTPYGTTKFALPDLEGISVSGSGAVAALGSREQIQVIEVPSGKEIFATAGRFPKLSPDGSSIAYISQESMQIRSLADGSSKQLLPGTRVMGAGAWSPNGRFITAGAWIHRIALEKRQVVIDTTTGEHAVIGKLSEGEYGDELAWISVKLL